MTSTAETDFSKSRRRSVWFGGLVALIVLGGVIAVRWRTAAQPWNVLLITLDTTRADRLGCYGHQAGLTPVLDQLARRGVVFERAYCVAPLTLPSHASMLTGLTPPEHGLHNNGMGALPGGLPTLATELKTAGYQTAAFVAAFVLDRKFGLSRGFDVYDDDLSQADPSLSGHHRYRPARQVINGAQLWMESQARSQQPFFCWVHLFDPHYPYLTHADRFGNRFAEQPYDAELAYVDAELGRLFATLTRLKVADRTMVVVVGDHGESLGEHGERTHSMTLYDATLRVPLLMSIPGESRSGHRVAEPVSLVDLSPTLLDCLGLKPISATSGQSLRPALRGEAITPRVCYAETDEPYHTAHWPPLRALLTSQWKYIRGPSPELYDLQQDPRELHNLAAQNPGLGQDLERQLAQWEQRMQQRTSENAALSEQERRALSSLGYAARSQPPSDTERPLLDLPQMMRCHNLLYDANELMEVGRYDEAEPILRLILTLDDQYFLAQGDLGMCLLRLNRPQEAIVHFRRSVELDPGADRVQAMLGAALLLNGDAHAAVEVLQIAVRLNPELYEARHNLGLSFENLGRTAEAIEQYRACLKLRPDSVQDRQRLRKLLND